MSNVFKLKTQRGISVLWLKNRLCQFVQGKKIPLEKQGIWSRWRAKLYIYIIDERKKLLELRMSDSRRKSAIISQSLNSIYEKSKNVKQLIVK